MQMPIQSIVPQTLDNLKICSFSVRSDVIQGFDERKTLRKQLGNHLALLTITHHPRPEEYLPVERENNCTTSQSN
jgi:hypothetical protein